MNNVPNLDGMTESELGKFWAKYHVCSKKVAIALVGEDTPKPVQVAAILANYAINLSCARGLRAEGKIPQAQTYEHACELHLARVPAPLRW